MKAYLFWNRLKETFFKAEPYGLKMLRSFSFYTNARKVFSVSNNVDQLKCLHGIRFLSLSWVILGHTYAFGLTLNGNIKGDILSFY